MQNEEKIIIEGKFEDVIEFEDHYYLRSKKDWVCVLPYTISGEGLLDKIGIVEIWNQEERKISQTLLKDYLNEDDSTNLVGANRVLYEIAGVNLVDASKWMFLGSVFNSLTSDSPIRIYAVDITDVELKIDVMNEEERKKFHMVKSSEILQSDDLLFLGAFTRLFNFFYVQSLAK